MPESFNPRFALASLFLCLLWTGTSARVVSFEVVSREIVADGSRFGNSGEYERIVGRVHFSVEVANVHNRRIVDLDRAENLKDGAVEFSADAVILRPVDRAKGNGTLLLEVPTRGRPRIVSLVDGGDWNAKTNTGDGWFLRNGYSYVALGWQFDAVGDNPLRLYAPVAKDHGEAITGLVRGDLMPSKVMEEIPLGHITLDAMGGSEYAVALPSDPRNSLTVRASPDAPRQLIDRAKWTFSKTVEGRLIPSDRHIHLEGGFQPGRIYEYVYVAVNPAIAGLGFAAVRDFAAYAKHAPDAIVSATHVIGEGISQTGRFLRDMLYQGFNADEEGQIALDGVLAHVAGAGRGSFNLRFAQPSRDAQPTSSLFFPTDVFPFTDLPETDPVTKESGGLLDRATAEGVVPRIFFSNTSYEYWGRVVSLTTTSVEGRRDVDLSPNVRVYSFTGLQHFSGPWPPAKGAGSLLGQFPQSPLSIRYFWRAMIVNMDSWLRGKAPPPASRYPRLDDGTLVRLDKFAFPKIRGVNVPHDPNVASHLDFGPDWREGHPTLQPPIVSAPFPVLVPRVDADGNERGGIRLPEVSVPLATYAPWNFRDPSIGAPDQRVSFEGSFLPFAKDTAARVQTGDPRPSVAERYESREAYLLRYTHALDTLIREGFVLAEDRSALLQRGSEEWEFAVK
jgi:hypothetical protein